MPGVMKKMYREGGRIRAGNPGMASEMRAEARRRNVDQAVENQSEEDEARASQVRNPPPRGRGPVMRERDFMVSPEYGRFNSRFSPMPFYGKTEDVPQSTLEMHEENRAGTHMDMMREQAKRPRRMAKGGKVIGNANQKAKKSEVGKMKKGGVVKKAKGGMIGKGCK